MTRSTRLLNRLATQLAAFRAASNEPDNAASCRGMDRIGRDMSQTRRLILRAIAGEKALQASRAARVSS